MKAIIFTNNKKDAERVFDSSVMEKLNKDHDLHDNILNSQNIEQNIQFVNAAECIFTTWGMPHFSKEEILKYFKNLKYIFYAAGSVQHFAREFLECGVRVFSSWRANAIPVAEYTFAQICLATKGYFYSSKHYYKGTAYSSKAGGNYNLNVGVLGVGGIGSLVCEKLKAISCKVYYYDPFLNEQRAKDLNITSESLNFIFKNCDVITNHLANKSELTNIINYDLLSLMKPYATFINTGRGKQVEESGLVKAMKRVKTRTAVLDVVAKEPLSPLSKLNRCKNIIVTPHIAGSIGREVVRMAWYMVEDCERLLKGLLPEHEVNLKMLSTMA